MRPNRQPCKIGIVGSSGRLGSAISNILESGDHFNAELVLKVNRQFKGDFCAESTHCDILIDVSLPDVMAKYLSELLSLNSHARLPGIVIGSTGWNQEQKNLIEEYKKRAPILVAPNFSPAVNLFRELLEQSAPLFKKWGYEVSLTDIHHNLKRDAPSGTAKLLLAPLENAGFNPQTNCVRAGKIVGTHTVSFIGPEDVFELKHEALNRDLFARGAILAALWLNDRQSHQQHGLYSMRDVVFQSLKAD